MEKTPWKKTIDPNFIGTYILPEDKPINVVITNVEWKKTKVMGQDQKKSIAYFAPNQYFDKPMLLNATNMTRLERITGSKYIEDWKNVSVTLQREMDKSIGGGKDWALRIAQIAPKTSESVKKQLNPQSAGWAVTIDWLKKGGAIETISEKYDISVDDLEKLKKATINEA